VGMTMYEGFFINLDRNEKRRQALIEHLEGIGAASRYRRLEAVDGRAVSHQYQTKLVPGQLGLWLSHIKLLEASSGASEHLHIVEDEAVFAANAVNSFDAVLKAADAELGVWDLIFTDVLVYPTDIDFFLSISQAIKDCEQTGKLQLFDLKTFAFSCTSSFFLNRHSVAKYHKLISDQWKLGINIDLYIRTLVKQGMLKAYLTVPFLTSVSRDSLHSDIRGGEVNRSLAVLDVYRRSFFRNADLRSLDAELQELIKGATHSEMRSLYLKSLSFCLSHQWVNQ
jgi:GR25 family glycosyltransferase involved in LPS biosynthesis